MNRRISLSVVTDATGTKCAPECVEWHECNGNDSGDVHTFTRTDECIAAEHDAREAQVQATRTGFALRGQAPSLADGIRDLCSEIARIRGGGR